MPETRSGGRIRVETGHSQGLSAFRQTGPRKLRGNAFRSAKLFLQLIAFDHVGGRKNKGRNITQRCVGIWSREAGVICIRSHRPICTPPHKSMSMWCNRTPWSHYSRTPVRRLGRITPMYFTTLHAWTFRRPTLAICKAHPTQDTVSECPAERLTNTLPGWRNGRRASLRC